jgi:hypothetical protein
MFLGRNGQTIPFKRKRVLGPWRSLLSPELRQQLRGRAVPSPER